MTIDFYQYYFNLRYGREEPLISADDFCKGILSEIDARKERRKKILAKIDEEMELWQVERRKRRVNQIKNRLSQIQEEAKLLEEELQRLDKGKQVIATPELPKEENIVPQNEALVSERLQKQSEDQSETSGTQDNPGQTNKEGEHEDEKWVKELAELDRTILLGHLDGKIPDMELLTIIKKRLQGPEVLEWTKDRYEYAIRYPERKQEIWVKSTVFKHKPTKEEKEWFKNLRLDLTEYEMEKYARLRYENQVEADFRKEVIENAQKTVRWADIVKREQELTKEVQREELDEVQNELEAESSGTSHNWSTSTPVQQQPSRVLYSVTDHYHKYPHIHKDDMPPLKCGCTPKELDREYRRHMEVFNPSTRMHLHCCKCKRPGNRRVIALGSQGYHQICNTCEKWLNYTVTEEWWYGKPCKTCLEPMRNRINVAWQIDVCSSSCKYAWLSCNQADDFTQIPTKIRRYIFSLGCRDQYLTVAVKAERYYRRMRPNEQLDYYGTKYHNQLSWMQMAQRFAIEYNRDYDTLNNEDEPTAIPTFPGEALAIRESFDQHEETVLSRIARVYDLSKDNRLGGKIKLCEECLLPYSEDELKKKNGRWLCIETETNREPCEPDNSGEQSTSPSQPTQLIQTTYTPPRPPGQNEIGPWTAYLQ